MGRIGTVRVRPRLILMLSGAFDHGRGANFELLGSSFDKWLDERGQEREDEESNAFRDSLDQFLQPRDFGNDIRDRADDFVTESEDWIDLGNYRRWICVSTGKVGTWGAPDRSRRGIESHGFSTRTAVTVVISTTELIIGSQLCVRGLLEIQSLLYEPRSSRNLFKSTRESTARTGPVTTPLITQKSI